MIWAVYRKIAPIKRHNLRNIEALCRRHDRNIRVIKLGIKILRHNASHRQYIVMGNVHDVENSLSNAERDLLSCPYAVVWRISGGRMFAGICCVAAWCSPDGYDLSA